MSPYEVIRTISVTEKSTLLTEDDKYTFVVHKDADKHEIKRAVEHVFERRVAKVHTMNCSGKKRRTRYGIGKRPDWKKAIVTLREGEEPIEFF